MGKIITPEMPGKIDFQEGPKKAKKGRNNISVITCQNDSNDVRNIMSIDFNKYLGHLRTTFMHWNYNIIYVGPTSPLFGPNRAQTTFLTKNRPELPQNYEKPYMNRFLILIMILWGHCDTII